MMLKLKNRDLIDLPLVGYVNGHVISKLSYEFNQFSFFLDKLETKMLFTNLRVK